MDRIRAQTDERRTTAAEFIATFNTNTISRREELQREIILKRRHLKDDTKWQEAMRRVRIRYEEQMRAWVVEQGFTGTEDPAQVLAAVPDHLRIGEVWYLEQVLRELQA